MLIYLDSSALLKLVRTEAETQALVDWLDQQPEASVVCSELGRVELLRAARRVGAEALEQAGAVVADLDLVPIDRAVQDLAAEIGEPARRTLDAVHLASAVLLGEALTAFVAYDQRLHSAAEAMGLPAQAPGTARDTHPSEIDDRQDPAAI